MNEQLTWTTAVAWAQAEIDRLRKKNDAIDLDSVSTAVVRGELAALKRLIDLPNAVARKAAMTAQQ